MDKPFETPEAIQAWLVEARHVPAPVAAAVASTLFDAGYVYPVTLLNIVRQDLDVLATRISPPHRNALFNRLQEQDMDSLAVRFEEMTVLKTTTESDCEESAAPSPLPFVNRETECKQLAAVLLANYEKRKTNRA